jgi:hypothetical protein
LRRPEKEEEQMPISRDGMSRKRWLLWFCGSCALLIPVALGMFWASTGFESLGLSGQGLAMVILMSVLVSAMGVGLMALVFQSDRSGLDELVYHPQNDGPADDQRAEADGQKEPFS